MYLCILRRGLYFLMNIVLLVWGCCSRTDEYISIFRTKVVRHAHWCAGLAAGEDVGHAGGNLDHGHWVQFVRRTGSTDHGPQATDHGKEEPVGSRQSVPDCRTEQTYIRRGLMCYVNYEICYLVHLT